MSKKLHIPGNEAAYIALEAAKRPPIKVGQGTGTDLTLLDHQQNAGQKRKAPPKLRKPSPLNDHCLSPTADIEGHRARLREAFGGTMSDEFVEVMLGKLMEALRPSPHDILEEATINAGLAIVTSMQPSSEFEALLAIQIVATAFSGMRFLRQSHRHMDETFIDVYGSYAIKLLRLQTELIHTFDRHRRGNQQTVEVRHVHFYPGAQGVVGIVNAPGEGGGNGK